MGWNHQLDNVFFFFVPRSEEGKIRSKFDLGILDVQIPVINVRGCTFINVQGSQGLPIP